MMYKLQQTLVHIIHKNIHQTLKTSLFKYIGTLNINVGTKKKKM